MKNSKIPKEIVNILSRTIGGIKSHGKSNIYLHEPDVRKKDWLSVKECLDRNFVSSVGNYVDEFEKKNY